MGAARSLFFSNDSTQETLNKRVRPSDEQIEYLRGRKDDLQDWIEIDLRNRTGLNVSTFLQGSYKFHTLIRPLHGRQYDVDLGAYIEWSSAADSISAANCRDHVQGSVLEFAENHDDATGVLDPPKKRCSRVKFKEDFHIDVPVYHFNPATGRSKLAVLEDTWEASDPEAMLNWFDGALSGEDRAQVRRLIRYLKAWVALNYLEDEEVPSSLLLTVLTVDAISTLNPVPNDDDDALRSLLQAVEARLDRSSHVQNPVPGDSDSNLNRLSPEAYELFREKLRALSDTARRATDEEEEADAAVIWAEAFDYLFPLPDVSELAAEVVPGTGIAVVTPRITIAVRPSRDAAPNVFYDDNVPFVRLGSWLKFTVTNVAQLPAGSEIRWVVRNTGRQAHAKNDLGHSVVEGAVHDEHTAYMGLHFMDCEIRVNGRIHAITRVRVNVTGAMPPRHAAPAFKRTSILKARRR